MHGFARRCAPELLRRPYPFRYTDANPFTRINIDPHSITRIQRPFDHPRIETDAYGRFNKFSNVGKVVAGGWDAASMPWDDLAFVSGFRAHFIRGVPWEETEFYAALTTPGMEWTKRWDGSRWDRISTPERLIDELERMDELYGSISSNGYRETDLFDELTVNIDRHGEFVHNNSASHRLCIARLLDVERVPARVLLRHRDWQQVRCDIKHGSPPPAGLGDHPDLTDLLAE